MLSISSRNASASGIRAYLEGERDGANRGPEDYYVESDPIGISGGVNTFAYALADPARKVDPSGLYVAAPVPVGIANPVGVAICVFACPAVAYELYELNATQVQNILDQLTRTPDSAASNVIPFPSKKPKSDTGNSCPTGGGDGGGCAARAAQLEAIKANALTTTMKPHLMGQYRVAAAAINQQIKQHNDRCPQHQVAPLPLGPTP